MAAWLLQCARNQLKKELWQYGAHSLDDKWIVSPKQTAAVLLFGSHSGASWLVSCRPLAASPARGFLLDITA